KRFAGNTLTRSAPSDQAVWISLGVSAPAKIGTPRSLAARMTSGSTTGVTMNCAPARRAPSRSPVDRTVPAPTWRAPSKRSRSAAIIASAPSVSSVTSTVVMPPRAAASIASSVCREVKPRRIPTMGIASKRAQENSSLVRSSATSHLDHDFALLASFLEEAVGLRELLERIDAIDRRSQPTERNELEDRPQLITPAERRAENRLALEVERGEIERDRSSAGRAAGDEAASLREACDIDPEVRLSDVVEDDVDAAAVRELERASSDVLSAIVDRRSRAERTRGLELR